MCNIRDVREHIKSPQRSYMWDISIIGPRIIQHGLSPFKLENVSMYAVSVNIPQRSREPIKISRLDSSVNFAGKNNAPKTLTITFFDDEALEIYEYMEAWLNSTANKSRPTYVREIEIKLKDITDQVVTGWILMSGCFPIEIADHSLNYSESGIIEQQITFIYDEILPIRKPTGNIKLLTDEGVKIVVEENQRIKNAALQTKLQSVVVTEDSLSDRLSNNREKDAAFSHKVESENRNLLEISPEQERLKFKKLTPTTTPLLLRITNPLETGVALITKGGNPLKGALKNVKKLTEGLLRNELKNQAVSIAKRIGIKNVEKLSPTILASALSGLESIITRR